MTASSQQSDLTKPSYGRLNGVRGNGWCAGTASSTHDWLQVDLGRTVKVCSLSAQGEVNGNRWVTDFKLRYSTDGISWRYYMNANGAQVVRFFNLNIFDSLYRNANFLPVNSSIRHVHISLNSIHLLSPLKFSITVHFLNFFWVLKSSQVNLKTILLRMQMTGEWRGYSINGEKSTKFILCNVLSSNIALRIYWKYLTPSEIL